jgi:hypothetical protein
MTLGQFGFGVRRAEPVDPAASMDNWPVVGASEIKKATTHFVAVGRVVDPVLMEVAVLDRGGPHQHPRHYDLGKGDACVAVPAGAEGLWTVSTGLGGKPVFFSR